MLADISTYSTDHETDAEKATSEERIDDTECQHIQEPTDSEVNRTFHFSTYEKLDQFSQPGI